MRIISVLLVVLLFAPLLAVWAKLPTSVKVSVTVDGDDAPSTRVHRSVERHHGNGAAFSSIDSDVIANSTGLPKSPCVYIWDSDSISNDAYATEDAFRSPDARISKYTNEAWVEDFVTWSLGYHRDYAVDLQCFRHMDSSSDKAKYMYKSNYGFRVTGDYCQKVLKGYYMDGYDFGTDTATPGCCYDWCQHMHNH